MRSSTGAWFRELAQLASSHTAAANAARSLVSIARFFFMTIELDIPYSLSNNAGS
jgi:hypothetical protein